MHKPLTTLRRDARAIFEAGIAAVDPQAAVLRHLDRRGDRLRVGNRYYDLKDFDRIFLVGAGKAGAPMAKAVRSVLGQRVDNGLVVVKYGHGIPVEGVKILEAGHPLPDPNSQEAAAAILARVSAADRRTLVLCLISGGGSALMALPVEGISLADKQATTRALLACGATIQEINTLRKHLSAIKGGRLARAADPAILVSLMLSDVIGDDPGTIASGPTAPDSSRFADCLTIIDRYGISNRLPDGVRSILEAGVRGRIAETPESGDPIFAKIQNLVVGRNLDALDAARQAAEALGYRTLILSSQIQGETRHVAAVHAAIAREVRHSGHPLAPAACILSGGETTVTMTDWGKGGRNQEFALAAALEITGETDIVILSGGTDGTDGPTDAAGAVVDPTTAQRATTAGLDPVHHLEAHDAYPLLQRIDDLLVTGPTLTNVMDLRVMLIG